MPSLMWILRWELRSLCLQGKHFTHWAISLGPNFNFLKTLIKKMRSDGSFAVLLTECRLRLKLTYFLKCSMKGAVSAWWALFEDRCIFCSLITLSIYSRAWYIADIQWKLLDWMSHLHWHTQPQEGPGEMAQFVKHLCNPKDLVWIPTNSCKTRCGYHMNLYSQYSGGEMGGRDGRMAGN